MRVLNERFAGRDVDLTDGIKVFDDRGWAQVLPDPDEPLIHLYAEGDTAEESEELAAELRAIVEEIEQGEAGRSANLKPGLDSAPPKAKVQLDPLERKAAVEPLPDLATLSDDDLKGLIDEIHARGAGGLVPAPDPAREDRHPARRARRAPAEDAGAQRPRPGRRRVADRDPRREGCAADANEPHLLSRVRLPEPGGRELLRQVRRAPARARARAASRRRRSRPRSARSCSRRSATSASRGRRSSSAPAAAAPARRSRRRATGRRSAARPTAASSSTTSRSRASTPSLVQRDGRWLIEDQGSLNGTFVNRKRVDVGAARGRRRDPDRQVPADLPQALMSTTAPAGRERLLTIGTVCRRLKAEFPDISISKIRYLEDQGLLDAEADAGRLPAVLRGRRRAARDDPAAAARRVPAAARDPRGARRRRRQGAPQRRRRRARGGRGRARPRGALRAGRHRDRAARASSRNSGCSSRGSRAGSGSTPRPTSTSPSPATRSRATGSRRATCARSARRPTASPACSRRSSRPALRSRNAERRRAGLEDLQALGRDRDRSSPSSSSRGTSRRLAGQ